MFKIVIRGLKDGDYSIDMQGSASEIEYICPEFNGSDIKIIGSLSVLGNKYTVTAVASAVAKLICDLSLEEYNEEVEVPFVIQYIADDELLDMGNSLSESEAKIIRSEEKEIDITDDVREILCVSLPMKRIAPKYRDKEFSQIYPEHSCESEKLNSGDCWDKLKNLKLN